MAKVGVKNVLIYFQPPQPLPGILRPGEAGGRLKRKTEHP
jgi:hypothetical protein